MSWCLPPRPWKSITPGQPPAGAVPSGTTSEQASFAPSEAAIVSCCGVAASAEPLQASAATSDCDEDSRRPTTDDRVALF